MAKRRRIDNTMAKRRRTDNTMAKRKCTKGRSTKHTYKTKDRKCIIKSSSTLGNFSLLFSSLLFRNYSNTILGPSWSWSYGSRIYNYLCNHSLSPLTLRVRTPLKRGVFDSTLGDKVYQWLPTGRWFSPGTPVSSTNKTERHEITEILLKVALSIINQPSNHLIQLFFCMYINKVVFWSAPNLK